MNQAAGVQRVDVQEAARRLDDAGPTAGPLLVDVRERDEFSVVRVPGAILVPLSEFSARAAEIPQDRPVLLMCAAGRRSMVAAEFLSSQGHPDVTNVEGGITAWQRAGQPVKTGAVEPGEGDPQPA